MSAQAAPLLWTRADLETELGMCRSSTFELVKRPGFPPAVRLTGENGKRRWYAEDVKAFIKKSQEGR